MKKTELQSKDQAATALIPQRKRSSLTEWFNLYLGIEGRAGSDNTFQAKRRDLESFLEFLRETAGTDHPDQWTRSVTRDFLKHLEKKEKKSATTINRMLATLSHSSKWIATQRPFLAGPPCDRIEQLELEDPEWKGLEDIEITRLEESFHGRLSTTYSRELRGKPTGRLMLRSRSTFRLTSFGTRFFESPLGNSALSTPRNSPGTPATGTFGVTFSQVILRRRRRSSNFSEPTPRS